MSSKEQIMKSAYGPTGYVAPREKQTASPKQRVAMSRELLKQALEALQGYRRNHEDHQPCDAEKAIEAELAKPDPEPVAWYCPDDPDPFTAFSWKPGKCSNCGIELQPLKAKGEV